MEVAALVYQVKEVESLNFALQLGKEFSLDLDWEQETVSDFV